MKVLTIIGVVLILLSIVGFVAGGISFTHEKKDIDLGPLQVEHKKTESIPISPLLSALILVGGIGFLIAGVRSR
jgi:hypothetical protein